MSWHLVVHYLDLLRHETISTLAWEPVKTNIGAGIWWAAIVGIVTTLVYPPLRRKVSAFITRHLKSETDELHRKLDHIIEHHPDIPDLPPKEIIHE